MSYPQDRGRRANRDQNSQSNNYVLTNTEPRMLLDFSELLPTPTQIETYNSYSTGNTPECPSYSTANTPERTTRSPSYFPPDEADDDADDEYSPSDSPPLSPILPAQQQEQHNEGPTSLIEWLDSLFDGMDTSRALTRADYAKWKAFLTRRYPHADFCNALTHTVGMICSAKADARALNVEDDYVSGTGFLTAMPLTTIAWEKVDEDRVKRMQTSVVKSGILQACAELRRLRVVIARHGGGGPGVQDAEMDMDVMMSNGVDGTAEYSDDAMDISSGESHY